MSQREIMGVRLAASGSDPPRERFFRALHDEQQKREAFEAEIRSELAELKTSIAKLHSGQRSETIKIICSTVSAIVIALAGNQAIAPKPEPPQVVVHRSKYDRDLEKCDAITNERLRLDCYREAFAQRTSLTSPR